MGVDVGFDMVPRLSREPEDRLKWEMLIDTVKQRYAEDEQVDVGTHAITFKAGEHPSLPLEGHKFLRFSSKLTSRKHEETDVLDYIRTVTSMAKALFNTRIQVWDESFDQRGFYDWATVHDSFKTYNQTETPQIDGPVTAQSVVSRTANMDLFEVTKIPGRGKGLVAKVNILKGTRILCEAPLLVVEYMKPQPLHETIARKLKMLSKNEQRQFLSLHNNFPGQYAFAGIVKTNALPCGSGSNGGIFLKACLINHSCIPNSHYSWNREAQHGTVHVVKSIPAGEEITISYEDNLSSKERWMKLQDSFGFQCRCELCTRSARELTTSDERRSQIKELDDIIGNPFVISREPLKRLAACSILLHIIEEEYGDAATALLARLYYDAFEISAGHGDEARSSTFAERAYLARVECEGEDSPITQKVKVFMQDPTAFSFFGADSEEWSTTKAERPKELDAASFEKWLWRLPDVDT